MKQKSYFWIVSGILILVIIVGSIIAIIQESHTIHWQELPTLYLVLGTLGCLLLIFTAKLLARYLLKRKGDYYD